MITVEDRERAARVAKLMIEGIKACDESKAEDSSKEHDVEAAQTQAAFDSLLEGIRKAGEKAKHKIA